MSHFAKINPKTMMVEMVLVGRDDDDEDEISLRTGHLYKRTSYNTRDGIHYDPLTGLPSDDQSKAFRGNFAGIGSFYDSELDVFTNNPVSVPSDSVSDDGVV